MNPNTEEVRAALKRIQRVSLYARSLLEECCTYAHQADMDSEAREFARLALACYALREQAYEHEQELGRGTP